MYFFGLLILTVSSLCVGMDQIRQNPFQFPCRVNATRHQRSKTQPGYISLQKQQKKSDEKYQKRTHFFPQERYMQFQSIQYCFDRKLQFHQIFEKVYRKCQRLFRDRKRELQFFSLPELYFDEPVCGSSLKTNHLLTILKTLPINKGFIENERYKINDVTHLSGTFTMSIFSIEVDWNFLEFLFYTQVQSKLDPKKYQLLIQKLINIKNKKSFHNLDESNFLPIFFIRVLRNNLEEKKGSLVEYDPFDAAYSLFKIYRSPLLSESKKWPYLKITLHEAIYMYKANEEPVLETKKSWKIQSKMPNKIQKRVVTIMHAARGKALSSYLLSGTNKKALAFTGYAIADLHFSNMKKTRPFSLLRGRTYLHGDLHPNNIIFNRLKRKIHLIDSETFANPALFFPFIKQKLTKYGFETEQLFFQRHFNSLLKNKPQSCCNKCLGLPKYSPLIDISYFLIYLVNNIIKNEELFRKIDFDLKQDPLDINNRCLLLFSYFIHGYVSFYEKKQPHLRKIAEIELWSFFDKDVFMSNKFINAI